MSSNTGSKNNNLRGHPILFIQNMQVVSWSKNSTLQLNENIERSLKIFS